MDEHECVVAILFPVCVATVTSLTRLLAVTETLTRFSTKTVAVLRLSLVAVGNSPAFRFLGTDTRQMP